MLPSSWERVYVVIFAIGDVFCERLFLGLMQVPGLSTRLSTHACCQEMLDSLVLVHRRCLLCGHLGDTLFECCAGEL